MTTYQYVGKTLDNDESIGGGSSFTAAGISGSLGDNATLIRSLTAASISGSGGFGANVTAVGISGSFTAPSSSLSSRTTTLETTLTAEQTNIDNLEAKVGQSLNVGDTPTFGGMTIQGKLTAETYAVSSSVTHMTRSFSSGSTIFGDSLDDTHQVTGSLVVTGSISATTFEGMVSGSGQIAGDISGSFNVNRLPQGTISGSEQLPSGIVSGSVQVVSSLPSGVISGSEQLPSGVISGSEQLPSGIISGSSQLPSGVVSGSSQITNVITQTYVSQSAAAAGFGGGTSDFNIFDLETAVVDENSTSILSITFITDSNGDLIKSSD